MRLVVVYYHVFRKEASSILGYKIGVGGGHGEIWDVVGGGETRELASSLASDLLQSISLPVLPEPLCNYSPSDDGG